jgi:flagellar export protein FliJ
MRFQFSLATVLRLRESIEKREKLVLQGIQAEIANISQHIDDLTAFIAEARRAQEFAMRQPAPAGHLQTVLWECQVAAEKRALLHKQLTSLEKRRMEQMKIYEIAHSDREVLVTMRERQRRIWVLDYARRQQKQLDDIFSMRRHRAGKQSGL